MTMRDMLIKEMSERHPEFADQIREEADHHPNRLPSIQPSRIGPFMENPLTGEVTGFKHYLRGYLELRWLIAIAEAEVTDGSHQ